MSAAEMRANVHRLIDNLDESFLKVVHSMLDTYIKEQEEKANAIIGHEIDGTPITVSKFLKQADEAVKQAKKGTGIDIEELEKRSNLWLERTK